MPKALKPPDIRIAGGTVPSQDVESALRRYATRTTLRTFDGPGPGRSGVLSREEIRRTYVVRSHLSRADVEWFLDLGASAPWQAVPQRSTLYQLGADGTSWDAMLQLWSHFDDAPRPQGVHVRTAKISKVLYVKRPAAYPLLDSHLLRVYGLVARARASGGRAPGLSEFWGAVWEDIEAGLRSGGLAQLRAWIDEDAGKPSLGALCALSDVRLLDIVAWSR